MQFRKGLSARWKPGERISTSYGADAYIFIIILHTFNYIIFITFILFL